MKRIGLRRRPRHDLRASARQPPGIPGALGENGRVSENYNVHCRGGRRKDEGRRLLRACSV